MATVFLPEGANQPTQTWAGGGGFQPWYYSPGAAFTGINANWQGTKPKKPGYWDQMRQGTDNGGMSQYGKGKPSFGGGRPTGAGGGGGSGASPTGQATVQTTITPQSIYTPQMTQQAVNQATATNTPDMRWAMKQNMRPGTSRSAGSMAAAMPGFSGDILTGNKAQAEIPLLDEIANQKHLLGGQVAREDQALSLANLMSRLNSLNQRKALNSAGNAQNILLSMLG